MHIKLKNFLGSLCSLSFFFSLFLSSCVIHPNTTRQFAQVDQVLQINQASTTRASGDLEIEQLEEEIEKLEEAINSRFLDSDNTEIEQLEEEIEKLKEAVNSRILYIDNRESTSRSRSRSNRRDKDRYKDDIDDLEDEKDDLEDEKDDLEDEKDDLEDEKDDLEDENDDLKAKIERLNDHISQNAKTSDSRRKTKSECEGDRDCERICDDIYKSSTDRRGCQDLSVAVVERLQEVHEALKGGDSDELEGIDYTDLDVLLSISIDPLEDAIRDYNNTEARDVAAWLAEEPDVVRIFQKEEDDYGLFKNLFGEINTDILEALSKSNITSGGSFMELIINANNEVALEDWVHGYLQDEKCGSADEQEFCVLSKYCEMDLDGREQKDLARVEYFEDFIEDLIEDANDGNIEFSGDNDELTENKVKCPVTEKYILEACNKIPTATKGEKLTAFFDDDKQIDQCDKTKHDFEKVGYVECTRTNNWGDINDRDIDKWGDKICR